MKLVTWNINSVRAREERLLGFLTRHRPDVLCLQELKVVDDAFPSAACEALGYHVATHGQRTYNGVAILSRTPLEDVTRGMEDGVEDDHARLISASTHGTRVVCGYFPNGGRKTSDKYVYKKLWMERLRSWLDARFSPSEPLALCGDFNVAPFADDVARPGDFEGTVLANPEIRASLEHIRAFGLHDVFRPFHPKGGVYSWWDYRGMGFERGNGLRIDHVYCTESLAALTIGAAVDREERKGKGASDHAPLLVEFDDVDL